MLVGHAGIGVSRSEDGEDAALLGEMNGCPSICLSQRLGDSLGVDDEILFLLQVAEDHGDAVAMLALIAHAFFPFRVWGGGASV